MFARRAKECGDSQYQNSPIAVEGQDQYNRLCPGQKRNTLDKHIPTEPDNGPEDRLSIKKENGDHAYVENRC